MKSPVRQYTVTLQKQIIQITYIYKKVTQYGIFTEIKRVE
jgi:hypothetical protein